MARSIREVPATERPRERLALRGVGGLTAAELIGLVWGSGTHGRSAVDLASDALARHDGLTGLARATELELAEVKGIGEAKAAQLVAAFELGRRLLADWPAARWTIRGPHDVADRLILQMGRLEREELRVVMLDTKNHVLRVATVYQGNVSSSLVRVGELFRDAVRLNAAGVILVHNHPSGDPTPSPDDLHLTAEALAAGRLLDIQLLDHLVIGHDAYVSLRDRGVAFDRRRGHAGGRSTIGRDPPGERPYHRPVVQDTISGGEPCASALSIVLVIGASLLAACSSGSSLTGKTWQWTAMTTTTPTSQSVVPSDQQANYTVEFKSDGTFASKADCNQVSGTYTTTSSGGLTIVPGPSTLAACPEGSLAPIFIAGLGSAASYTITNGALTITTQDAATLTFK